MFYQNFSKHSFIAFSIVLAKNSIPCLHKGAEDIVAAPVTRKILKYFYNCSNPRLQFFSTMKNAAILSVSYNPIFTEQLSFLEHPAVVPVCTDGLTEMLPLDADDDLDEIVPTLGIELPNLFDIIFYHWLLMVKEFYKITILLTLLRL